MITWLFGAGWDSTHGQSLGVLFKYIYVNICVQFDAGSSYGSETGWFRLVLYEGRDHELGLISPS